MAGNNYEKKMRFTPYLPYGFCSKLATTLEGKSNHYARQLTLGDDPTETIALSEQHRRRLLDKVRYMGKKEYTCDIQMTCGTPPENRSFRRITKTGIEDYLDGKDFYVCCLPDQAPWYKALFPNCTIL